MLATAGSSTASRNVFTSASTSPASVSTTPFTPAKPHALDAMTGSKFDLIITDINMPNMGGIEFISKTRALPGFRFIPILALTTESEQVKRDEAKKLGATNWLLKPVSGSNLNKIIKQVLPGA